MTSGNGDSGAEITWADVSRAEMFGSDMVWGRPD